MNTRRASLITTTGKEGQKNVLYIFLHVPKCAGSTFRHHIRFNFKEDEAVSICSDRYFDVTSGKYIFFALQKRREQIDEYLFCLTDEQKDKIRILHGHGIYYGIHRFFHSREARYITFLRHPLFRVLSEYNYIRSRVELPHLYPAEERNVYNGLTEAYNGIIHDKRILPFSEWFQLNPGHSNYMTRFLKEHAFGKESISFEDMLKKFYFVGITENYKTDALFLYHLLGIKKFYPDQNISKKYIEIKSLSKKMQEVILRWNTNDMKLYEHALRLSRSFKRKTFHFWAIVFLMRFKFLYQIPKIVLTSIVYPASCELRQRSRLYAQLLDKGKERISLIFKKHNQLS